MAETEFLLADFAKFDAPAKMHLAFFAMHEFVAKHGRMPAPWSEADADLFVEAAKGVTAVGTVEEVDAEYLKQFAKVSPKLSLVSSLQGKAACRVE